jgi:3-dehydroquinate dehydratase/shikimate dehydrogenase
MRVGDAAQRAYPGQRSVGGCQLEQSRKPVRDANQVAPREIIFTVTTLRTDRLILRPWRDDDLEPFAALSADPEVMRYFPSVADRERSETMARRVGALIDERGWGLWAVEVQDGAPFIGFIGLQPIPFEAHFTPAVEVGWRLAREHWGRGYAPEGARAAVEFGFDHLELDEIVSMTTAANVASQRVMQKLGMTRDPDDDFDHPNLPDWEYRRHILYRLRSEQWNNASSAAPAARSQSSA